MLVLPEYVKHTYPTPVWLKINGRPVHQITHRSMSSGGHIMLHDSRNWCQATFSPTQAGYEKWASETGMTAECWAEEAEKLAGQISNSRRIVLHERTQQKSLLRQLATIERQLGDEEQAVSLEEEADQL